MSDIQNSGGRGSVPDTMSREAPDQALRNNFCGTDASRYIPEALSKRKAQTGKPEAVPASGTRRGWGLIASAAVLAVVIAGVFKLGFRGFPANWPSGTFHLSSATKITEPKETDETESVSYTGLRDALQAQDISVALAPVWFPEGYEEGEVRFTQLPSRKVFAVQYLRGEESIIVRISHYSDTDSLYIAQNASLIGIYESGGVDYRIFGTEEILQAVWINEGFECFISGPLTISELERMIDSIASG